MDALTLLSPHLVKIFWSLTLDDLHEPKEMYDRKVQQIEIQLRTLENNWDEVTSSNKEEMKTCLQGQREKLIKDQKKHERRVKRTLAKLREDKDMLFPANANKNASACTLAFLQSCIFPGGRFTTAGAVYCAELIKILHDHKTPNFLTIVCYDNIFNKQVASMLKKCTAEEAEEFGRFLSEVLKTTMRWHSSKQIYERVIQAKMECEVYPGFAVSLQHQSAADGEDGQLDYEAYRNLCYKWHCRLNKVFITCLNSDSYLQMKNTLLVLIKILPHYPKLMRSGCDLRDRMEECCHDLKGKNAELFALALGYWGQLEAARPSWTVDSAFHGEKKQASMPEMAATGPVSEDSVSHPESPPPAAGKAPPTSEESPGAGNAPPPKEKPPKPSTSTTVPDSPPQLKNPVKKAKKRKSKDTETGGNEGKKKAKKGGKHKVQNADTTNPSDGGLGGAGDSYEGNAPVSTTEQTDKEQQLSFDEITEACIDCIDKTRRSDAQQILATATELHQMLPSLINFITEGVKTYAAVKHLPRLMHLMKMVKSLMDNSAVNLEQHLENLTEAIKTCIVHEQLCLQPSIHNHWVLRDFSARLMGQLCKAYSSNTTLWSDMTMSLAYYLWQNSTTKQYGAIIGLAELGPEAVETHVLSSGWLQRGWCQFSNALEGPLVDDTEKKAADKVKTLLLRVLPPVLGDTRAGPDRLEQYEAEFGSIGATLHEAVVKARETAVADDPPPAKPTQTRRKRSRSSEEISKEHKLVNPDIPYTEENFAELTTYLLFNQHFRHCVTEKNPGAPVSKVTSLIAAKWREFKQVRLDRDRAVRQGTPETPQQAKPHPDPPQEQQNVGKPLGLQQTKPYTIAQVVQDLEKLVKAAQAKLCPGLPQEQGNQRAPVKFQQSKPDRAPTLKLGDVGTSEDFQQGQPRPNLTLKQGKMGAPVIGKTLSEDTLKCKNFLEALIRISSKSKPATAGESLRVTALTQELIDGDIEPEEFCERLKTEVKPGPQPYLVPFLKKNLPQLRQLLDEKKLTIEGVHPPQLEAVQGDASMVMGREVHPPQLEAAQGDASPGAARSSVAGPDRYVVGKEYERRIGNQVIKLVWDGQYFRMRNQPNTGERQKLKVCDMFLDERDEDEDAEQEEELENGSSDEDDEAGDAEQDQEIEKYIDEEDNDEEQEQDLESGNDEKDDEEDYDKREQNVENSSDEGDDREETEQKHQKSIYSDEEDSDGEQEQDLESGDDEKDGEEDYDKQEQDVENSSDEGDDREETEQKHQRSIYSDEEDDREEKGRQHQKSIYSDEEDSGGEQDQENSSHYNSDEEVDDEEWEESMSNLINSNSEQKSDKDNPELQNGSTQSDRDQHVQDQLANSSNEDDGNEREHKPQYDSSASDVEPDDNSNGSSYDKLKTKKKKVPTATLR